MKPRWSTRADTDLVEIWRQISVHSEIAADAMLQRLQLRCEPLEFPEMGPLRGRRHKDVRQLVEGNYVIFYRVLHAHVEILRVFDARRELSDC